MDCITPEKLVAELHEYSLQCADNVEFFTINEGWHGAAKLAAHRAELDAVRAFIAYLVPVAAKPEKAPRCAFYREIRRCYAIAREAGLDVKADARMRAAFSRFLGREVETRETLRAGDWLLVADAIKSRRLAW
jgi:DNA-binding Lrp family transcriptional regulator